MGFAIATICGHVDGIRFHLYITAGLDPKNLLFGEGGGKGRGRFPCIFTNLFSCPYFCYDVQFVSYIQVALYHIWLWLKLRCSAYL